MPLEHMFLVFSRLPVLFPGLSIAVLSYAYTYTRMNSGMILFISVGLGLVTLGALVEGLLFEFLGYRLSNST